MINRSRPERSTPDEPASGDTSDRPPIAWRPVGLLTLAVAVAHTVASLVGYWFDEVYMVAIGRYHLDWARWTSRRWHRRWPRWPMPSQAGSLVLTRVPAIVATAAAVLVSALIARELGGKCRAHLLAALTHATTLWSALAGH